ncbi:MAG: hypothetical protein J5938_00005 [Clostridia bacterium]|nr:hypothetical protein [Clostridia bacterium]
MKNVRKSLLFACAVLVAAAAASCGETPNTPTDGSGSPGQGSSSSVESSVPEETESVDYSIPEPDMTGLNFGGAEFAFFSTGLEDLWAEKLTGETVNDAVFKRDSMIEDKLNVKITASVNESYFPDEAVKLVTSGDTRYQVYRDTAVGFGDTVSYGIYIDMRQLPYCDFTQTYWNPYALASGSVYGKNFFMPSDFSHVTLSQAHCVYFNKRLMAEYDVENPYDLVDGNRWTIDNYLTMIRQVSRDVNGDGEMGIQDHYGVLVRSGRRFGTFLDLYVGSGQHFTTTDESGVRILDVDSDMTQSIIDKISTVLKDRSVAFRSEDFEKEGMFGYEGFMNGHALFMHDSVGQLIYLREMEDDFGILPNPKYDDSQENYAHRASPFSAMFAIPSTNEELEMTGAVMEYGSWLAHYTTIPAYYEITVKQKRTRDEKAMEMLDIIHDTIVFDFGDMFDGPNIANYMDAAYEGGSMTRGFDTSRKKVNKALNRLCQKLNSLS